MSVSFVGTAVWGLIVLAAFVGWGGAIERRLFGTSDLDAGLRGAWGMALGLFIMAVLALFSLASKPSIFFFVAAGVVFACVEAWRRRPTSRTVGLPSWGGPVFLTVGAVCLAAVIVQYLSSIGDIRFNVNDDYIAYFPFAKAIVQRGTLFDPFSTRLVMSFGGQSFLHAIVLAGAPSFRLHLLDEGLCMLLAALLIIGTRKKDEPVWPAALALLVLITLPHVKINTHAEFSGVVLFYALYRTLVWSEESAIPRRAATPAILALVAVAACTLRSNYLGVAIPMLGLSYAKFIWTAAAEERRARLRETMLAAAFGLLFLTPWMVLAFRSSGTPLFPVIRGHFNDAFPMLQRPSNFQQELSDLRETLGQNAFLPALPLFVLAGLLLTDGKQRAPLRSLLIATATGWLLLIAALASDVPSFLRYVYGFVVAVALAVLSRCSAPVADGSAKRLAALARVTAVIAALTQLFLKTEHAWQEHVWMTDRIEAAAKGLRIPEQTPVGRQYAAMQQHVPARQRLLVMVDFPHMLDFSRNEIFNVDTAAAVSPPPGMPYFQGAERVAQYLRGSGIRYVAFTKPTRAVALYRRDVWEKELRGSQPLWHAQAPIFLDMFDNFERLAAGYRIMYDDGTLVLFDLNSKAASPPRA